MDEQIKLSKPRLYKFRAVIDFDRRADMRLLSKDIAEHVESFFGAQAQALNVPDFADPNQPRFVFGKGLENITISQVRAAYSVEMHNGDASIGDFIPKLDEFLIQIKKFIDPKKIENVAFLPQWSFAIADTLDQQVPVNYLHKVFFKDIAKFGEGMKAIDSFAKFGFRDGDINIIYAFSAFETRDVKVEGQPNTSVVIKVTDYPVTSVGVDLTLDVNAKPISIKKEIIEYTFSDLCTKADNAFKLNALKILESHG